jgi:type VI secretion system secreted protein Hcp
MADIYAFLDLEGIPGEAQDSKYDKKIELQSFSWGASNNSSYTSGTGSGIGKGQVQDISISKFTCSASLKLLERAVSGKPIPKGKLTLLKLAGETKIPYFEAELENVVVTSFHISASGGGQLPMESATLHFVKVKSHYKPQSNVGDAQGPIEFGWDLQKNESA